MANTLRTKCWYRKWDALPENILLKIIRDVLYCIYYIEVDGRGIAEN